MEKKLNLVKVIFQNPSFNYYTSVSYYSTEKSCKEYFVGKFINLGNAEKDNVQRCIDIEFTDNNKPVNP
jgi:hypothetical protein